MPELDALYIRELSNAAALADGNYIAVDQGGDAKRVAISTLRTAMQTGLHAVAVSGSYNDLGDLPTLFDGAFASLSGKPTTLGGYGITDAVPQTRAITTSDGITGGGDLSGNLNLSLDIDGLTAETSIDGGDFVVIYDVSATAHRKMTRSNFVAGISGGGTLLVQEVDGSPGVAAATTLEFTQTVGFVVTDEGSNVARVTLSGVPYSALNLTGAIQDSDLAGSIANAKLANSSITIAGNATSLGGSVSQDNITGLSSTGLVKRTGANALAIAVAGTDYENALTFSTGLTRSTDTITVDTTVIATRAYAESLVVGLLDDRGNYDASGNTFPASGGSGTAGAILKGDLWTISVAGILGGVAVTAGDLVRALVDAPGQTGSNWAVSETNIGYTALNATLNDGQIYIGNGSNVGTARTLSGDVTVSNTGVTTIGASKVINSMLADATLQALAVFNSNGLITQTAADTFTARTITGTSNVITVTNGDGVSGNPTITIHASYAGQASITTLGTITSGGLGSGASLGAVTMSLGSDADGDIYYRSGNVLTRLPKGTALHVLRMNAGATAPEWAAAAGGGLTVGTTAIASGTATRLLYETSGNVLGEISGATSDGTNVTYGSGNLRATLPQITTGINDSNGNELFLFTATGSAVNELTVANAATSGNPTISATGGDANIGIALTGKGTGAVNITNNGTTAAAALKFAGDAAGTGWSRDASFGSWYYTSGGTKLLYMSGSSFRFTSGADLIWASSTDGLTLTNGAGLNRSGISTLGLHGANTSAAATFSTPALSPAQITADQNNYAPGVGWFIRLTSDASRNLTGLVAGVDGQIAEIWNVGSFNIVIQDESSTTASTAANRFLTSTAADLTLTPKKCALLRYDATSARWRVRLGN